MPVKNVGTVEGAGGWFCQDTSHDEKLLFDSAEELEEHKRDGKHVHMGAMPCAVCSKEVTFDSLPYGKKPICDECKAELLGQ